MKKSMELYVHIPFCRKKCGYCDFLSFSAEQDVQKRYVEKLLEEIRKAGETDGHAPVSSIFIGGGTPSILEAGLTGRIMKQIKESFHPEPDAEISMEANPGTVTEKKLSEYRDAGINRLSFGLQSADDRELRELGRIHTFGQFLESFRMARECGFDNLNVDLMSALPGQTAASWEDTLKKTAELGPEHISAYSLIIEEGTPFYGKYGNPEGKKLLPDEDTERDMYHRTGEILKEFGYERYEISNYAKPGRECRHNTGYWTGVPYLGLGLGAASFLEGRRFSNPLSMEEYLGQDPSLWERDVQILEEKDLQAEFFFLGLRLVQGVSLREFERRFHVTAESVYPGLMERCVKEKTAVLEGDRFRLTDLGLDVSNYVMAQFLQD